MDETEINGLREPDIYTTFGCELTSGHVNELAQNIRHQQYQGQGFCLDASHPVDGVTKQTESLLPRFGGLVEALIILLTQQIGSVKSYQRHCKT